MYKSQLQEYAQKAAILPPVYEFVKEGASHEPRFKAMVILNNVTYESPPGFPNLKSAEHAAAKAALDGLLQTTGRNGVAPSPVHESGLCKNLLQEYAQKNSLPLPVYQSKRSGEDHAPTFSSSVEIAGVRYSGGSAKNKKEAEIKAARTALLAIQSSQVSVAVSEPVVDSAPQPQVGFATFVNSHMNKASKKRGRIAGQPTPEERNAVRLKTLLAAQQGAPRVIVKSITPVAPAETTETNLNNVSETEPKVQFLPTKASVDIADMFATPSAKKILGVVPKVIQTESPSLPQEPAVVTSGTATTSLPAPDASMWDGLLPTPVSTSLTVTALPSTTSLPSSPTNLLSSHPDMEVKGFDTRDAVAEEILAGHDAAVPNSQIELVNGGSDLKEDQSFIQTAQASSLITSTG